MAVQQSKNQTIMRKTNYISPEVTVLDIEVEQGFGASQDSPNVNIGIGDWEEENDDYILIFHRFDIIV